MSRDKNTSKKHPNTLDRETVETAKSLIVRGVGDEGPRPSTRFQKGQSGNPNGRPSASKPNGLRVDQQPLMQAVRNRASKTLRMRKVEVVSEVDIRDALLQSVFTAALKGLKATHARKVWRWT